MTIGNSVTYIGRGAFYYCTSLTSVTIPNSVTNIEAQAFNDCRSLTSVTIPDSVIRIGDSAFRNTPFYNDQPDGLIIFGKVAYKMKGNCPASVTIPSGIISIGDWAFFDCNRLTSVTIPNSVTNIGGYAFSSCTNLISVTIPNSVTNIGFYAFWNSNKISEMSMLGFTCDTVKNNVLNWGIAVLKKQFVTIQCSDGFVILNAKDDSSGDDGKIDN